MVDLVPFILSDMSVGVLSDLSCKQETRGSVMAEKITHEVSEKLPWISLAAEEIPARSCLAMF